MTLNRYKDSMGRFVTRDEAFSNGSLRDGYSVVVSMLFADSNAQLSVADAERAFADSGEGQAVIARARMVHELTRPGVAFTDADATAAVRAAMANDAAIAEAEPNWKREADMAEARADAERDRMIAELTR